MRNYGCFEAPPVGLNSLKIKYSFNFNILFSGLMTF